MVASGKTWGQIKSGHRRDSWRKEDFATRIGRTTSTALAGSVGTGADLCGRVRMGRSASDLGE
jgi:hypothetical protein